MKKIILLNILFFVLLMCLFLVAAFSLGYLGGDKYGTDAGILYLLVVTIHLFLNYLIMHKQPAVRSKQIWVASAVIGCIYLLIIFH